MRRTDKEIELASNLQDQAQVVKDKVSIENQDREEMNEGILQLIKEMAGEVRDKLENEKKDRISSEETML